MLNPRLASRYAKALIDLATETGQLDTVFRDMELLHATTSASRELTAFLRSPVIHAEKKEKIFTALFTERISTLTDQFSKLLIRKGREGVLPEVMQDGIRQYRRLKHIRQVKITTAVPLDEALREQLVARVKADIPDEQIELLTSVDESLVGGFILETENQLFDASISRDLQDIKRQFLKNVYVRNIR